MTRPPTLGSVAAWPAIIHLVGPPGAGTLTVATALVEEAAQRNRRVVLLDNHRTTNVVFAALGRPANHALSGAALSCDRRCLAGTMALTRTGSFSSQCRS